MMHVQRVSVKLPLTEGAKVEPRDLVPVFHRFIQRRALDEITVDVVDYAHVHHGPGVLLVCHAADYALDEGEGERGLLYRNKRDPAGPIDALVAEALRRVLVAARWIETDEDLAGRAHFRADRLLVRVHDRLLAPNDAATHAAGLAVLDPFFTRLYGGAAELTRADEDPRALWGVRVAAHGAATGTTGIAAATLLARLDQAR